jgi:hypothetical protein
VVVVEVLVVETSVEVVREVVLVAAGAAVVTAEAEVVVAASPPPQAAGNTRSNVNKPMRAMSAPSFQNQDDTALSISILGT